MKIDEIQIDPMMNIMNSIEYILAKWYIDTEWRNKNADYSKIVWLLVLVWRRADQ